MEGSSNQSVTPDGVREGDPTTLRALVDRRGPAVIAFCTQVCGPANASTAAAEAFARFRAAVRDAPDLDTIDPETLLRGATRHAAASMARTPMGPPPHGKLRSRGTQTCEHVPVMLAARANLALGAPDLERLARHLDRCERCNAMAEIFHRAELAYQDPAVDTLGLDTSTVLLEALEAVPVLALGQAPAPADGAPLTEPIDGAYGHLPDLEDEIPLEPEPAPEPEPQAEAEAAPDLDVEHVDDPAEELEAADLAAEPLPEEAPAEGEHEVGDEADEDADDDLGETMEWEAFPSPPEPRQAAAVGAPATGKRRSRGALIVLPAIVVAAFVAGALALAGVFGGDQGTPPQQQSQRAPVGIERPVLTPLPVKVAKPATPAAGADTSASSATPSSTASTATP